MKFRKTLEKPLGSSILKYIGASIKEDTIFVVYIHGHRLNNNDQKGHKSSFTPPLTLYLILVFQ